MFCLVDSCRYRSGQTLKILIGQAVQPRLFSPVFNSVISYADACNPQPCGGKQPPKKCRPERRKNPCGPKKGGGGHELCYKPYIERGFMDHDRKNMALKRPMSPHLQIFSMTVPAGMSIVQRITGTILTSYALLIAGGTLFLANGIETYVSIIQSLDMGALTVNIVKLCLGLPFAYHYFNGIRFCIWNLAILLSMKEVNSTANIALLSCVVAAAVFAFLF